MARALEEDVEYMRGFGIAKPAAQIFVTGPQGFKETLSDNDKKDVRDWIQRTNVPVVIHGAYVDNPWNRAAGSVHNIKQELRICESLGAKGVIVHLGKGAANDENFNYVLDQVSNIEQPVREKTTLFLEINAAKPTANTFETPQKIRRLFERVAAVDTRGLSVGLCIDSAHLFSCGFAMDTYERTWNWLTAMPRVPVMMHLNDSLSTLGSGVDAHGPLTKGNLWSDYDPDTGRLPIEESGLMAVLDWATENNVMLILERDTDGIVNDLSLIRSLGYFQN